MRPRARNALPGENLRNLGEEPFFMADSHADDPNTPPIHYDVRERFTSAAYALAAALGLGAVALGIILGVILAND